VHGAFRLPPPHPATGAPRLKKGKGFPQWKADQVAQFLACLDMGVPVKRAVAVAAYSGLRISDLVALTRAGRRDGVIEIVTGKTGAKAWIPEHPELTRWLDQAPASISPALLTTVTGRAWKVDGLQKRSSAP
jgi:hypothetical protein